ncbi:Phosphotyrosyl phosphatase activator [Wilcoxina mikolae CBS 423.85]|nr:Phosphotyrosyl phosphatase activator [Wilcoxina mikolae CBS 423.85]
MPISSNKPPSAPTNLPLLTPPPPPLSSLTFTTPTRRLVTPHDLTLFQSSPTHTLLLSFITDLSNSVLNLPNSSSIPTPPIITTLLDILSHVESTVSEFPPEDAGGSRFGNKSFQRFYDAIWERAGGWHRGIGLPEGSEVEVKRYFCESFGNRTRIDYGSGHELNFVAWLLCFRQLGLLPPETYPALVLRVFNTYLSLMRRLQTTYYLEPAGSHGVWGLDDYQFLPFLFGSSQLYSHAYLRPKSIHSPEILEEFEGEYIYLSCISFINSIKTTAGLRWHSPMLDDISAAKNWGKINQGMLKMYEKEVLGKLPVMQHFMFGGILEEEDREGMRHVHSTWGECCGIKVPAAVAAREAEEGKGLRSLGMGRLPFD